MIPKLARNASLVAALAVAGPASAQINPLGIGSFTGSTLVDFNTIGNEALITNQFSSLGVIFSGALYGVTNVGDLNNFPPGANVVASNWLYSGGGNQGLSFTAQFSSTQNALGFWLENWPAQLGTVELFLGALSLGTIAFGPTTSLTAEFFGLQSVSAFDRAVFTNTSDVNGFFAIDDFQFFGTQTPQVPEPITLVLLGSGLLGVGAARRRKNRVA